MEPEKTIRSGLPAVSTNVIRALETRLSVAVDPATAEREAIAVGKVLRAENPHLYQVLNHELNRMMPDGFHIGVPLAAALTYDALRREALRCASSGEA